MSIADIAATTLEGAFNRCLNYDALTRSRFAKLQGRVIAIALQGIGTLYLLPDETRVQIFASHEGEADVTLSGTPFAFARMGLADDSADSLFQGDVTLSGDSALGQRFGEILKGMDIEWEEMASQVMGDVLAHKLGNAVRGGVAWSRDNLASSEQTCAEYLQEELRQLPVKEQVDEYLSGVDTLRNDVERAEARLKRLVSKVI